MNNTVKLFGVRLDNLSKEEAFKKFLNLLEEKNLSTIFTPNPEIVMLAQEDVKYKEALLEGDLIIADGIGIIIASKIKKLGIKEKIPGIDFMESILKYANNSKKSVYFLGAKEEVVKKAVTNISNKYPNIDIKGYHNGYFIESEELKVIDDINEVKPDILFVALGAPKQEKFMIKYKNIINAKVGMGVGGAFDVYSGFTKRAPKIFRKIHLEWLYRIITNPRRIKRSFKIPKFLMKVLLTKNK